MSLFSMMEICYLYIVKKAFNKYFVVSLSLMLILSNFSFATQLMICEMMGDTNVCECTHNDYQKVDVLSFTQERSKCCNEETTELSNTNTLLSINNELNHNIYTNVALFFNTSITLDHNFNSLVLYSHDKSHFPKLDIPIFTSSLLI